MNKISGKAIRRIMTLLGITIALYIAGSLYSLLYIIGLIPLAVAAVLIFDISRCPHCERHLPFYIITEARKNITYCSKCGKIIEIDENK